MTSFSDGPAQGQTLMLGRAPIFLRVVEWAGAFDALDQIDDTPEPEETIHVYQRVGEPGRMHVHRSGGKGGWFTVAEYAVLPEQPDEDEVRRTDAWQAWCRRQSAQQPANPL